jgi:hypothetical protein
MKKRCGGGGLGSKQGYDLVVDLRWNNKELQEAVFQAGHSGDINIKNSLFTKSFSLIEKIVAKPSQQK